MGIPLEIPPLLEVVLTLSAMLGLFAYAYWLASKDDRRMRGLNEIKPMNSEGAVTSHERSPGTKDEPTTPIATNGLQVDFWKHQTI